MALLLIPLFLALMYLLVVLPQQRRVRSHEAVVASLQPGQEVMTTSGVYGRIVSLDDEFVQLEIAPEVQVKIARASVGLVVPEEETQAPSPRTDTPEAAGS